MIVQAQQAAIATGMTYSDVKEISTDVVKYELDKFNETAFDTLLQRFGEFVDNYYNRQTTVAPEGFSALRDPFMQRALRTAQVEFGASGKPDVGEFLADLLVDLSQTPLESMQAIYFNDALSVVPKLNKPLVDALTANLILRLTLMNSIMDLRKLYGFFERNVVPLGLSLPAGGMAYRHLQFTQTAWLQAFSSPLAATLQDHHGGLFSEGFPKGEIPLEIADLYPGIFVDHERYNGVVRVVAPNINTLEILISRDARLAPWSEWLKQKLTQTRSTPEQIEAQVIADVPGMDAVFQAFSETDLDALQLTSVGIVIAHANWKAMGTGEALPLAVYLPDSA